MEIGDWRAQLYPDSRQRNVNKIMGTLKRHLKFPGPEGINELGRIASRFEERIYTSAINQMDYLHKISVKLLTLDNISNNNAAGSSQSVCYAINNEPLDSDFVDLNNLRPAQPSGGPVIITGDWRAHLQPESRQRIVNKIMETLMRHLPFSGPDGLNKLWLIASVFEEKVYLCSINQSDYLRRIALKMLAMETRT